MPVYQNRKDMQKVFEHLAERTAESDAARALHSAGMVVSFVYHDPDITVVLDGRTPGDDEPSMVMRFDTDQPSPDVTFECSSDVAHEFWTGRLDVMQALARGTVRARGSISKALRLLPLMPPLFSEYEAIWSQRGEASGA